MKKLSLNQIKKKLNFSIQKGISMDLRDFVENTFNDIFDYDVYLPTVRNPETNELGYNLQRPLCWNLEQKQELVISVLKGISLASISIIIYKEYSKTGNNTQTIKVVDGKQRMTTLISFMKNEFPLTIDNENYYYSDLDEIAQRPIKSFSFITDRVYEYPDRLLSDQDKIDWFTMINFAGNPQEKEHQNNLKIE